MKRLRDYKLELEWLLLVILLFTASPSHPSAGNEWGYPELARNCDPDINGWCEPAP